MWIDSCRQYGRAGAALILASLVVACEQGRRIDDVEFRAPVTVEEVVESTVERHIVTTGVLRVSELATLTARSDGILEIAHGEAGLLREGDRVRAGQVIASITGEDVRLVVRRNLAQKSLEIAEDTLNATKAIFEEGLITIQEYGKAQLAYEEAKLELERSIHEGNGSSIVAPIEGTLLELARDADGQTMANGQRVSAGQVIAKIAPLETLIADIDLVSEDVGDVDPGMEATVKSHAWRNRTFPGRLLRLSPVVHQQSGAFRAEVKVANHDGKLRPGSFVEVVLVVERRERVPVIPRRSLTDRGGRRVVFVLDGQRVEERPVELGLGDDTVVEVVQGLSVGERVVVLGLETLADQMPVRVTSS